MLSSLVRIPLSILHRDHERLVGEASTAGLPVGEWPELLTVVTENLHLDVSNVYRKHSEIEGSLGELIAVRYVADGLPPLHLLND